MATVNGDHGTLGGTGTVTLVDAVISSYITGDSIDLDGNAAPNTAVNLLTLLPVTGLEGTIILVFNKQETDGNGADTYSLAVDAIRLTLDVDIDLGELGINELSVDLTGEIIIAHSAVSISARPNTGGPAGPTPVAEPATLTLMGLGFTALCWQSRRKAAVSFA